MLRYNAAALKKRTDTRSGGKDEVFIGGGCFLLHPFGTMYLESGSQYVQSVYILQVLIWQIKRSARTKK